MTDLTASKPLDHSADEADVEKRTVLDYIWEPVSKVKELALRD